MITKDQITALSKRFKINETTIFREYLQILFLNKLYASSKSARIFFKGGTALHLIYQSPRFSEDLDFTVALKEKEFLLFIQGVFKRLSQEESVEFKERKTIAGRRFLLTGAPEALKHETFINLDFSFREKVLTPEKSILETDFPVLFTSFVHHLSKEEIFAEKIRAVITRRKGRDLYDLWYLLNRGVAIDSRLIKEKLKYYRLEKVHKGDILKRVNEFSEKDFVLDLRPFLPLNERERLKEFFVYLKDYLYKKL